MAKGICAKRYVLAALWATIPTASAQLPRQSSVFCAVQINCDGLDLAYCFAAMTAAIRNHFEMSGCKELVEMLPAIVRNVLDDKENFPLNVEIEK